MKGQLVQKTFTLGSTNFDCWVIEIDNKFWFKAHDIAVFLGYQNPRQAILKKSFPPDQNNNASKKKSSMSKKWNDLVSKIWKEVRTPKVGSGIIKKYHKGPIEYKYINNITQLMQRLYFIYAVEKAGNNNFHDEKMGVKNFFSEQLEGVVDTPKGTEYVMRFVSCLPKGLFKGSNIKYVDNLSQLMEWLYLIHTKEKAGKNNFHIEKMDIINHFEEQLDKIIDTSKGTEYLIRFISCLPKGVFKVGSGILNTLLNKLGNVVPEMHLPGYNYCGPFTKLEQRLARGDAPINKMDAGCQKHDIFYHDHRDTKERHVANKELAAIAKERMYASDASVGEKINAALIRAAMNSKVAFGMGIRWG